MVKVDDCECAPPGYGSVYEKWRGEGKGERGGKWGERGEGGRQGGKGGREREKERERERTEQNPITIIRGLNVHFYQFWYA